ncbi:hypothetical protein [Cellulomonas rhizosphaerae]|uniref:Uncharacterized protein n=1 Tax=Cellulomonas rhizosphaerae TaxID=2293719 RepID=A0A413RMJ4_9CELL|nr:hypothetical protein [Cellulomonas rhizosphaerae]RHA42315.1 hypothetical protein D1825_07410 [Cellulomonas rhizosphaerae]
MNRGRRALLRLGLPRDPAASRYLTGFLVSAIVTVMAVRALLAATGYPQVGGQHLHLSHVLWGGLLMALAFVLVFSFLGPVTRPFAAVVGGVGFGLFVDEIGKFVTSDYDYFYAPTASLVYLVIVALALVSEALHGRRPPTQQEYLAAAADAAVAGVAGGFSPRARRHAHAMLEHAGDARGRDEVAALLDAVTDDRSELPDPTTAVADLVVRVTHRIVRARWVPALAVVVLLATTAGAVWRVFQHESASGFVLGGVLVGAALTVALCIGGLVLGAGERERGFRWFRRAVLVSLLVTQVFLFRLDEWGAAIGLVIDLLVLGLLAAELDVLRRAREE